MCMFIFRIKPMVFVCLLCVGFTASSDQDTELELITAQIEKNPEQQLELVKQFWSGKEVKAEHLKAGLLMVTAWIDDKQFEKAGDLLQQFNSLPNLSDADAALLLAQRIYLNRQTKQPDDDGVLIQSADALLSKLMPYSDQTDVSKAIHALNRAIALKLYFEGSFAQSEPYYHEALSHLADDDYQTKSDLLDSIGVVKAQQADLAGAAKYMLESIKVLEQQGMPVIVNSYQNLGSLNFMLKEWDKTIEYSEKALSMEGVKASVRASLLSNIAAAYVEKGELNVAIDKLNQSIEISENIGINTSSARNNLGYIYNQVGEYDKALEQLEISQSEMIKAGQEAELSLSYKSMADVYANMQDYKQADAFYQQAYQLHQLHDFKMKRVELYPKWIDVLVKTENYQKAYEMVVEFKALNDEITDVESTKQVNEVMAAFEVEKNKKALQDSEQVRAQQQKSIDLLNSRNELQGRIRTLMIIMVVALVLLLLYILRSWRFRGQVNHLLLDKNQRIESQQSQLLELNSQLKGQAEVDSLTGIHNRRYIANKLAEIIADPKQAAVKWCLIIIDLDDFKAINDTYGHQRGDEVLQQFAECLDWVRSADDVIARWGGEEFLWLVKSDHPSDGPNSCDTLQTALADLTWFRGNEDTVTCSMGYTSFPLMKLSAEDWEVAIKLADDALYRAKKAGKNRWYGLEVVDPGLSYTDLKETDELLKNNRLKGMTKNK